MEVRKLRKKLAGLGKYKLVHRIQKRLSKTRCTLYCVTVVIHPSIREKTNFGIPEIY